MGNKPGIICCTRMKSNRVPNKCSLDINGRSLLEHLHVRLRKTNLPIVYAYPRTDIEQYSKLFLTFKDTNFKTYQGWDDDPLQRMYRTAEQLGLDTIIRVVHDKVFVDDIQIRHALNKFNELKLDYLYSSTFTDGTGFEIISFKALEKAAKKFRNIEHITYAIKAVTDNSYDIDWGSLFVKDTRLLVDFPEDLDLMTAIFACLGNDCSQMDVYKFLHKNKWAKKLNKLPKVTVYTCGFNAGAWLRETMNSVISQRAFKDDYEYILVDDCSSDNTALLMSEVAAHFPNVKYIRNKENLGLASSSNIALSKARGKYIIRLDADDYFVGNNCIETMLEEIEKQKLDALYPNYYNGDHKVIGLGPAEHHPAGTLFKTLALNHIRFRDGLRHYEGKDLYLRAKDLLKIGYLNRPIFFYRHHVASLSKNNLEERAIIREKMENNIEEFTL